MSTSSTLGIDLLRWGARATWPFVFALGCSSSDFTVASTVDDAAGDETASDTSVSVDSALDGPSDDAGADSIDDARPPLDSTVADTSISIDASGTDTMPVVDARPLDSGTVGTDAGGPVDTGPEVGTPCTANDQCGSNAYCNRIGCNAPTGTCKPMEGIANYGPQCGCDGLTYWNSFQAATFAVVIAYGGLCKEADRKTCTALGACPNYLNSECIFEYPDALTCTLGTGTGTCWRNPAGQICPAGASGPAAKTCGGVCTNRCTAVSNNNKFYLEPACPG